MCNGTQVHHNCPTTYFFDCAIRYWGFFIHLLASKELFVIFVLLQKRRLDEEATAPRKELLQAARRGNSNSSLLNPILLGGGQICPHPHVIAYTHLCMRVHVPIFFYFSSFLVCMKVQHIWPHKTSPFSQDKSKLVKFTSLSQGSTLMNRGEYLKDNLKSDH